MTNPTKFKTALAVLREHRKEMGREEISEINGYIMALMDNVTLQNYDEHAVIPILDRLQMVYDSLHEELAEMEQSCDMYDETEVHIASGLSRAAAKLENRVVKWADIYADVA